MSSKAGSIGLILGGVALVYLAATGYAGGVWEALKGPKSGGMGGQVSNVPYIDKGVFYASPSGGMMVSDSGIW